MSENQPQATKKSRGWVIAGILAAILVAAGLVLYPQFQQKWAAPLGPALNLPTYTPTFAQAATEEPAPVSATGSGNATLEPASPSTQQATHIQPTAPTIPTATPEPLCGGPALMTILGVGVDTDDDTYTYGLGDAIRVARVDFTIPKITVLSIPRDLWVEIPGISDHYGITHGKLNQAYFYGSPGMAYYDGSGGGPGLMAETLDLNFGLRVDHYGALNMITFSRIVDAIGGIDIYLPYDVDGTPINSRTDDMGYFTAGNNHFNGDEAMRFSRIRKRYNDFTRMDHQNMVICAIRDKILSPAVLPKIPQIISAFKDSVVMDLSLEQMSQLACLLPYVKSENLIFTSLPDELFTPGRVYSPQMRDNTFIMEADMDEIRQIIQEFNSGDWPTEKGSGGSTCP